MSTSNMAISPSPGTDHNASLALDLNSKPSARRRSVAMTEKKTNAEMHSEVGINGVGSDRLVANGPGVGKDFSHTIRGELVLEKSKDLSQLRKGLIPAAVSPRRKKVSKHEKPRWETVLSILTKNCLLLAALLWLGQTVYRWSNRIEGGGHSPFVPLDYEGWVSDIESSLKKTAKMLQVQLEVVDKKIGSEIESVKRDFAKQLEEKGALFENEIKKLDDRTDTLDKSMAELRELGLLSKEEFESFWDELKKSRGIDGSFTDVHLDEVRALAKAIVEKEIEKHAADGLGKVDYALATGGARVVRHSEPFRTAHDWLPVMKVGSPVHVNARKMLEPSFGEPGQCFALQGSKGFAEIRLRAGIIPEAVTLEHVAKSVSYDRSSAPKDCRVFGWFEAPKDDVSTRAERMILLTEFKYDLEKSNAQTFNVEAVDIGAINMVRFEFTSNHGSPALTCIYRFRVHGYEPKSALSMDMEA